MSSDRVQRRAAKLLALAGVLLDEQVLAQRIDDPIDEALRDFDAADVEQHTSRQLIDTVARFLQHACQRVAALGRQPTLSQARDEAFALLERGYRGVFAGGYEGALVDASDPSGPGVKYVVAQTAELLKYERRQMHIAWVKTRYVDSADWETKCAMASVLLRRCYRYLPPEFRDAPPEQKAEDVFELLYLDVSTTARVRPAETGTRQGGRST